ncbi:ComEA family DNA-binding protein [Actinosynnema sp. NPDC020468]|uniref:ComEA family DNA-binding protein n=1 Tax=Actinosynnema sp. NPDC020468 TaxID=3154488 RepID=UPI0033D0FF7D
MVAGAVLAAIWAVWWRPPPAEPPPNLPVAAITSVSSEPSRVVVDVVGEVPTPGLVTVPSGARVADAVQAAGGAKPGADLAGLNLARKVVDGEQIPVGIPASAGNEGTPTAPLNLNTATKDQLDALPGIGPVTAQRIVERRQKRGPFTSVEQLGEIEGIGDTRLQRLGELLRV